eukprot:Phypoly_transcript_22924.p1 GENE.Phypoly_transcript_22924~~Phypoly_transcript_22924.p1  ORF type:complete len:178 (+),score=24.50 Phypoly_transcript_22924:38-535(+)
MEKGYMHEFSNELVSLIQKGWLDVNVKDALGRTALIRNAIIHSLSTTPILFLLNNEADVNATDNQGWTALHHACNTLPPVAIVKVLLDAGAKSLPGRNGVTPLHLICSSASHKLSGYYGDCAAIAKMLVDYGGDLNAKNDSGNTPMDLMKNEKMQKEFAKLNIGV